MTEDERNQKRDELLAAFLLLMQVTKQRLVDLVTAHLNGTIQTEDLSHGLIDILTAAHAAATDLGRQMAGQTDTNEQASQNFAIAVMSEQTQYLANLVTDLRNGRYDSVDECMSRLDLYVRRLRGTANEAWVLWLPDDTRFIWHLGAVERHCEVCPERAEESATTPYTQETLPGTPGDGGSPCLSNCDCELEAIAGDGVLVGWISDRGFPDDEDDD